MRYAVIMAGGAGTRLWPMSRKHLPKQLVRFLKDDATGEWRSLLKVAVQRLEGLIPHDRIYLCTNEAYRQEINDSIPEIPNDNILGEPVGRDTVNAVGFAAAVIHKRDQDATIATLTADHIIKPADTFRSVLDTGFNVAEQDARRLVTFNITPTHPATGFGYVERGEEIPGHNHRVWRVEQFAEKPTQERAHAYVESGHFGWNSGMFVWKSATILDCIKRYKPESHAGLQHIADDWDTPQQRQTLERIYPTLPKISVDYAIMEPAAREQQRAKPNDPDAVNVATVEMNLDWLDVGSWPAFSETLPTDEHDNKVTGPAELLRSSNTLIVNNREDHLVACVGCDNLIIVHTEQATLVMPASRAQELKALHERLPEHLK